MRHYDTCVIYILATSLNESFKFCSYDGRCWKMLKDVKRCWKMLEASAFVGWLQQNPATLAPFSACSSLWPQLYSSSDVVLRRAASSHFQRRSAQRSSCPHVVSRVHEDVATQKLDVLYMFIIFTHITSLLSTNYVGPLVLRVWAINIFTIFKHEISTRT